jgi:O-antigen ligase
MTSRELHPVALVGGLALVALLAVALSLAGVSLHRAQQLTALAALAFFVAVVWRSHVNGLVLLFLLPPLFNGEDARPYFWLLEGLAYLTLAAGFGRAAWRREPVRFPGAFFFLLFLASAVVSFPLNAREVWAQVQVQSWTELLRGVRAADIYQELFYVRAVLNVASGIGLYVLAVSHPWSREALLRLAAAATVLCCAVTAAGLALHYYPVAGLDGLTFLTVRFGGREELGGFGGLGFNTSYFAQYALPVLPLLVLAAGHHPGRTLRVLGLAGVPLVGYAVLVTRQRAAYILLVVAVVLLVAASVRPAGSGRRGAPLAGLGALVVLLAALLAFTPLGAMVGGRIRDLWAHGDPYRSMVLGIAWQMFRDEPLLGIGTGQYGIAFLWYLNNPYMRWGSLSSHNLYVQLLAEQGLLGLGAFAAIVLPALGRRVRRAETPPGGAPLRPYLLVSLLIWLLYGLFQFTFLMRSTQLFFWLLLGLLVATAPPAPRRRAGPRLAAALVTVLVVAGAFRAHAAAARPIPPGYSWGLHDWQAPDGSVWTRGGAVLKLRVQGPVLRLAFAFPVSPLAGSQRVEILLDGTPVGRLVLDAPAWRTVEIPVAAPTGRHVLLGIRVARTFTPAGLRLSIDPRRMGVLMRPAAWPARP